MHCRMNLVSTNGVMTYIYDNQFSTDDIYYREKERLSEREERFQNRNITIFHGERQYYRWDEVKQTHITCHYIPSDVITYC
jgi:hypothetical protein